MDKYEGMDEFERMEVMAKFLNDEFLKFINKRGSMTSAATWARYLQVSNTSLSQWMNAHRLPVGKNAHKLADKLGPVVYDILGMPRLMSNDEGLNLVVDGYMLLDDEERALVIRIVELLPGNNGVSQKLIECLAN